MRLATSPGQSGSGLVQAWYLRNWFKKRILAPASIGSAIAWTLKTAQGRSDSSRSKPRRCACGGSIGSGKKICERWCRPSWLHFQHFQHFQHLIGEGFAVRGVDRLAHGGERAAGAGCERAAGRLCQGGRDTWRPPCNSNNREECVLTAMTQRAARKARYR